MTDPALELPPAMRQHSCRDIGHHQLGRGQGACCSLTQLLITGLWYRQMSGDDRIGSPDRPDIAWAQPRRKGEALDGAEGYRVDLCQLRVNRQPEGQQQLPWCSEGAVVEIELEIQVAAACNHTSLHGRAMRDEANEPGREMA